MVAAKPTHRLLLRAELTHGNAQYVTHTIEISESLVFVQIEETAFIGDKVHVRFSFPGLVDPFSVETQVIAKQLPAGPGRPGGWTLGFVFYNEEEQQTLRSLLSQIQVSSPEELPGDGSVRGSGLELGQGPGTGHDPQSAYHYRVLLVEDNLMTREAFALGVSKFFGRPDSGVSVDIVDNGQEAWNRLKDDSYDLAIIDYFLPVLNGDRLIARLRRDPSLARLPVVAISVGGAEAKQASLDAGADLFLHKPIVLRDLFATLQQLTSVRSRATPAQSPPSPASPTSSSVPAQPAP